MVLSASLHYSITLVFQLNARNNRRGLNLLNDLNYLNCTI
jgi:hypothetical protein